MLPLPPLLVAELVPLPLMLLQPLLPLLLHRCVLVFGPSPRKVWAVLTWAQAFDSRCRTRARHPCPALQPAAPALPALPQIFKIHTRAMNIERDIRCGPPAPALHDVLLLCCPGGRRPARPALQALGRSGGGCRQQCPRMCGIAGETAAALRCPGQPALRCCGVVAPRFELLARLCPNSTGADIRRWALLWVHRPALAAPLQARRRPGRAPCSAAETPQPGPLCSRPCPRAGLSRGFTWLHMSDCASPPPHPPSPAAWPPRRACTRSARGARR